MGCIQFVRGWGLTEHTLIPLKGCFKDPQDRGSHGTHGTGRAPQQGLLESLDDFQTAMLDDTGGKSHAHDPYLLLGLYWVQTMYFFSFSGLQSGATHLLIYVDLC